MFGVAIYGVLVLIGFVTLVVFGILIYFLYRRFEEQDYLLEELKQRCRTINAELQQLKANIREDRVLGKTAQARGAYPANHVSIANKTPKEADFKRPAVWQQFNSTPPRDNLSTNDLGVKITEEFNRASDNAQEKEAFLSRYKSQRIDIINNDERIRNPAAPAVYGSSEGGILFAVENSGYNFVFPYFKLNFTETIKEDLKSVFDIQDDSTSSNFVQFEVILPALFQKWNSGWQLVSQGKLRLF